MRLMAGGCWGSRGSRKSPTASLTTAQVDDGFARMRELPGARHRGRVLPARRRAAGLLVPETSPRPRRAVHSAPQARRLPVHLRRRRTAGSGLRAAAGFSVSRGCMTSSHQYVAQAFRPGLHPRIHVHDLTPNAIMEPIIVSREISNRAAHDRHLRLDLRSAFRSLGRARGTAAAAVLTLAVAIGLNLAMFGLIDRALLSPPAHVADAGRVFTLAFEHELENGTRARHDDDVVRHVRDHSRERVPALADAAAWQRITTSAVVDGTPIGAEAMLVSGSTSSCWASGRCSAAAFCRRTMRRPPARR